MRVEALKIEHRNPNLAHWPEGVLHTITEHRLQRGVDDRLNRFPPVEEFDFYNAQYLAAPEVEGADPKLIPIKIEVVLIEVSQEVENRCGANLEFWRTAERRILVAGEVDAANPPDVVKCLRLETLARYNPEEDEFETKTYFSHTPLVFDGLPTE